MSQGLAEALAPVDVGALEARAIALRDDVGALAIDSEAAKGQATGVLARIQTFQREAEAERVRLVKPQNDHVKAVNDAFKRVLAPVAEADRTLRSKVLDYHRRQQQIAADKAAEAERLRLESAARLKHAEVAEASGNSGVAEQLLDGAVASETAATAAQAEAVRPSTTMRTEAGTSSVKRVWTFRLIALAQVPIEYLVLDEVKVREALRQAARIWSGSPSPFPLEIQGLEILQEEQLAVRR